jgi:alanyl aminopeptidase
MRRLSAVPLLLALAVPAAAADTIGRLDPNVVPVGEAVRLELDARQADYSGSVEIALAVKASTRSFRFHAEEIDLKRVVLHRDGAAEPPRTLTTTVGAEGMVTAEAAAPLAPGRYTLTIDFTNDFDRRAVGLYRLQSAGEWYAFTQFEAVDARKAFPCWDEPSFKIPWRVTLTVPQGDLAIANAPEDRESSADGKRTVVFKPTRPLPSYLIAFATGPLETVPVPGTSIPTRVVVPKGTAALAGEAVAMTPPLLASLERYFGSRYPYEKLDLIAVPEYWYGAMENPGAITFKDDVLLLDSKTASNASRQHLAIDIAHEIAHMWFGDLVTMRWWDDLWLNESFASWMEVKTVAEVYPRFEVAIDSVRGVQGVMDTDAALATHAMRQPVGSVASLLQSADQLAYVKGASVLEMVETWLTPEVFRKGVAAYLRAHADANATGDDLWGALGKASGKDVRAVLSSFLDQPGVPLVTARPLPGGKVALSQTRFLNSGAKAPGPQLWKIPVMLAYPSASGVANRSVLLTKGEQVVDLGLKDGPAWIHPNAHESGYYRWSVPREAFLSLGREPAGVLDVPERIGLLGNASALLDAGQLAGDAYVRILEAFASDPDPHVVATVVDGLAKVRGTFYGDKDDAAFAAFVRRTLRPPFEKIGASPRAGESDSTASLRASLLEALAREGDDAAVLDSMEALAQAYGADPASVDPSIAGTAIGLSALRGDAALFDQYRARFEGATNPADRRHYLAALGSFRDPALTGRALDYVFTGPLRPQEAFTIPQVVAQEPSARDRTWTWMIGHYDVIRKNTPQDFIIFMPYFAAGCSSTRLAAAKEFFSVPEHDPPGTARELATVAEGVEDCVRLDAREGEAVRKYIASR